MVQSLQDVLPNFAKKLTIQLPVEELKEQLISKLNELFSIHQGDFNVTFEVLELEKVKRFVKREMEINDEISDEIIIESDDEVENLTETIVENQMEEIEETIIKNKLEMPSRKLKINISKELLEGLEKMQVNFKLN
jgi:DNA polymerase-3 subunit alpha